jgi:DNA-binding transcriptional ArsR family regulator
MSNDALSLAGLAQVIGDPSRAEMLQALMDGRAWTGKELARAANVTPSTASTHLDRLVGSALLVVVPQGRFRYYRIASPDVAHALESLAVLAPAPRPQHATARAHDTALRRARTCYDHLAGTLGVSIAEALRQSGAIEFDAHDARFTAAGTALFERLGIACEPKGSRPLSRACLDWSERRWHLAGRMGAALCRHALENEWVRRHATTRALDVTARGAVALSEAFGVAWPRGTAP